MGNKSKTFSNICCNKNLLVNKENLTEFAMSKDAREKCLSKNSEKPLKKYAKTRSVEKPIKSIEEDKQKAKFSGIKTHVELSCSGNKFGANKTLTNARKITKLLTSSDSTKTGKNEINQDFSEINNNGSGSNSHHNHLLLKNAVVILKRCEDIQKETVCSKIDSCSLVMLEDNKVDCQSKENLPRCEKNAVVILKRFEGIQKETACNKIDSCSLVVLEDNKVDSQFKGNLPRCEKNAVVMLERYEDIQKETVWSKIDSCSLVVLEDNKVDSQSKDNLARCEKNAVVMLKRYEDIQEETVCSKIDSCSLVMLEDNKVDSKSKSNLPICKTHISHPMKEAVVLLETCTDIQKSDTTSLNNWDSSNLVLGNNGKAKTAANKSGKGTKRKKEVNKSEGENSSQPKKKKDSAPSKSSKKEKIPDVSAIDFKNDSKSPNGNLWNFKISSWNINGIRAWLEKNGISYLHHEQPDIMCIQETKCSDDKLPDEMKNVEGYHAYWLSGDKDGYSGVGLLSKEEPIKVEYGIGIEEHDNEGRVITAEYEKFYLVSTYVPNAGRGLVRLEYRMKWDKDFREYLKKLDADKPVILCGDLNVAHEEIDLKNPKTNKKNAGFTKEEREGFSTLLKEGFIDTFRHLYPDLTEAYTFWTYMMNARAKNVGWRLDYFVISERFTENLCDNVIRKDVFGSDHCPITLFLSL